MSNRAVVTTDGPHYLWAPNRAKETPPNLKIWDYQNCENSRIDSPSSILTCEHLLLNTKHILTGTDLTVD
jgi:hypothetical protein